MCARANANSNRGTGPGHAHTRTHGIRRQAPVAPVRARAARAARESARARQSQAPAPGRRDGPPVFQAPMPQAAPGEPKKGRGSPGLRSAVCADLPVSRKAPGYASLTAHDKDKAALISIADQARRWRGRPQMRCRLVLTTMSGGQHASIFNSQYQGARRDLRGT